LKKLLLLAVLFVGLSSTAIAQGPPPPPPPGIDAIQVYATVTAGTSGTFTFTGKEAPYQCGSGGNWNNRIDHNYSGFTIPNATSTHKASLAPVFTVSYSNVTASHYGNIRYVDSDQDGWCFEGPWTEIKRVQFYITVVPDLTSFSLSSASGGNPIVACDLMGGTGRYHDGSGYYPVVGDTIYSSSSAASFDGQNRWYKVIGTDDSIKINSSGEVTMSEECIDGGSPKH